MTKDWLTEEDAPKPWTLAEIYADLVCGDENIAKVLNVKKERVHKWIERGERIKCPQPVRTFGSYKVYSAEEWKAWYRKWLADHPPNTKWTDEALVHGAGENFFTYEQEQP